MSLSDDLKAYLDGELDSSRTEQIRHELDRDPVLRQELSELQAVSGGLKQFAADIRPEGLEGTLLALGRRSPRRTPFTAPWVWGTGAVLAVLAGIIAILPRTEAFSSADSASPASALSAKASVRMAARVVREGKSKSEAFGVPLSSLKAQDLAKMDQTIAPQTKSASRQIASFAKRSARVMPPPASVRQPSDLVAMAPKPNSHDAPLSSTVPGSTGTVNLSSGAAVAPVLTQTVALRFPSLDVGTQQVLALVGKYQVDQAGEASTKALSTRQAGERSFAVDLPEDDADKMISDLKKLEALPAASTATTSGAFGGFGGGGLLRGGGRSGRSMNQKQGNSSTPAARGAAQLPPAVAHGKDVSPGKASEPVAGAMANPAPISNATKSAGGRSVSVSKKVSAVKAAAKVFSPTTLDPTVKKSPAKSRLRHVIIVISEASKPDPVP